jgi:hypothetical protein
MLAPARVAIGSAEHLAKLAFPEYEPKYGQSAEAFAEAVAHPLQTADAMLQALRARYGGAEEIKNTLATDPVGFLADASTVLTGAGGAARMLGAQGVAARLGRTGRMLAPTNVPGALMRAQPFNRLPERLITSDLLLNKRVGASPEATRRVAETALQQRVIPTESLRLPGLRNLQDIRREITAVDAAAKRPIAEAARRGEAIPMQPVVDTLNPMLREAADTMGRPREITQAIMDARRSVTDSPNTVLVGDELVIPIDAAQRMKQATYKDIKARAPAAYSGDRAVQNSRLVEAERVLNRGIKDQIYALLQRQYPELRALGQHESALLNLEQAMEDAIVRIGKRHVISPAAVMKGGIGTLAAGREAGIAMALLDVPVVKSAIAHALNAVRTSGQGRVGQTLSGPGTALAAGTALATGTQLKTLKDGTQVKVQRQPDGTWLEVE